LAFPDSVADCLALGLGSQTAYDSPTRPCADHRCALASRNRGKALTLSLLKRQNAQRLEQIDRQIATVEAAILQIVEADESLADRFAS
jgi:hypothetical protein